MEQLRYLARRALTDDGHCDAVAYWRALGTGHWTVLDRFDADGRRYVVACRQAGGSSISPEDLTLLQRRARGEALKVLAFDLGLSVSAVSRRLSRAMSKLGVRSQTELPRLFGH